MACMKAAGCAGAFVVAGMSALTLSASQVPSAGQQASLAALCGDAARALESGRAAVAGPRIQFHSLPAGFTAESLVHAVAQRPQVLVAGNARWVAMHDSARGELTRRDCAARRDDVQPQPLPVERMAISQTGQVAQLTGISIVVFFASPEPVRIDHRPGRRPSEVSWTGNRLMLAGRSMMSIVDPLGRAPSQEAALSPGSVFDPSALLTFNGLAYVHTGDCIDIFVGQALSPRLERVACPGTFTGSTLAATDDKLTVLSPDGGRVSEMPRPSVTVARMTGSTFEITNSFASLVAVPKIPRLPFADARAGAGSEDAGLTGWSDMLPVRYWRSGAIFEKAMADIRAKGWTGLRKNATDAWTGRGVAGLWRSTMTFVRPGGRGLAQLASQLTDQKEYTDAQVRAIIRGNASLARTLEGTLFDRGWIPITTLLPPERDTRFRAQQQAPRQKKPEQPPFLFFNAQRTDPKQLCLDAPIEAGDATLSRALQGVSAAPMAQAGPRQQAVQAAAPKVKGSAAVVVTCRLDTPSKQEAAYKLLYVDEGDVGRRTLIGVSGVPEAEVLKRERAWLDVKVASPEASALLLPATILELTFVAYPGVPLELPPNERVSLASAEAVPATPRQSTLPCETQETAKARRLKDERLMGLDGVPRELRTLSDRHKIGVAENAVDVLGEMFKLPNGESVWVETDNDGSFRRVSAVDPAKAGRLVGNGPKHGNGVAGILVSNGPVPGLLSKADLAWIDLGDSPSNNRPLLERLAALLGVVNVSQKLAPNWKELDDDLRADWKNLLLFVAAAKNLEDQEDHGSPLTWGKPSVLGVGVVDGDGNIPAKADYGRDFVDLLAPGLQVPTVVDVKNFECPDGTSYATAYVTAVAAIVSEAADSWTPARLRARLLATSTWKNAYAGHSKGGVVNAAAALKGLENDVLVVDRGAGVDPLHLNVVEFKRDQPIEIRGREYRGVRDDRFQLYRVPWRDVLRWQRVEYEKKAPDGTLRMVPGSRVSFISRGRYVTLEDASSPQGTKMPLEQCEKRDVAPPLNQVQCVDMDVDQIQDYTAALRTGPLESFASF